ncbi:MAG: DeoR/GlpR family DNA-binding transcription regulator [Anaerolineae bacterium]
MSAHKDPQLHIARNTNGRRREIAQLVQSQRRVSVAQLSARYSVSEVSIRRDLEHLARLGLLRRVHGGAEALGPGGRTPVFEARRLESVELKQAVGRAAAELIGPEDVVLLDAGTTVLEIARTLPMRLKDGSAVTVVTRSLAIASELRTHPRVELILLGGVYVREADFFVGSQVETALRDMHVDTLFVGASGISLERGLTTAHVREAGLYRLMANCADRVVVVVDSGKLGVQSVQTLLGIDEIDVLVVDGEASPEFVSALQSRGVSVIVAPSI